VYLAAEGGLRDYDPVPMPLEAGSRVGPYEIVGWLGAGGMGEVYRARDLLLARDVAIKLISERASTDPARLLRFAREARAAGQLNHPNILAVFNVGTHEGMPYLVSELLEGEPLRARLQRGALPPARAAEIARQIADGLGAAHDRSIVHRDIKPDNLFITSDGRLKILDFGIAKLTRPDELPEAVGAATDTAPEVVVGTVAYMSPEQVRGEVVDARSDIFSLGAVLYEMLAGRPAFLRGSPAETTAAVLKEEPDDLPARVPQALARIVERCLDKSRDARFQSARDLEFSLDSSVSRPQPRWWPSVIAAAAGGAVLLAAGSFWATRDRTAPLDLGDARITRLTDWEGTEGLAEVSPDGRYVLIESDKDGEFDLHVSEIGTGEFTNLTTDIPGLNPPGIVLRGFGFSGNSSEFWYSETGQPGDRKRLMRLLSRTSRPFLGEGDAAPAWSPDGSQVVYLNNKDRGGDPLFVADASGRDAKAIHVGKPGEHNHNPAWSLDGKWIYFVRGTEPTARMDLWRVPSDGGEPEQLTRQSAAINFFALIDTRTVLYVAGAEDSSGPWLWSLDIPTGAVRRVGLGVNPYMSISASRDGRRIVATVSDPSVGLWTVPLSDRMPDETEVRRLPVAAGRALAPRVRGDATYYLSSRGTVDGLYRLRRGDSSQIWQDSARPLSSPAAVSRDGSRIAIVVNLGDRRRLVVMNEDGTNARTLAANIDIQGAAGSGSVDWSSDGAWLVAGGTDAKGAALFRIPADGGNAVRLVEGHAVDPICSPDGKLILYAGTFVDGQVPLRAVTPDGQPTPLPDLRVRQGGYRFLPDGKAIVYLERTRSVDFWRFDIATGTRRQLTRLADRGLLHAFDLSADGRQIVFDRLRENSNIALIELPGATRRNGLAQ
jgi:serine/threonine protein kinase